MADVWESTVVTDGCMQEDMNPERRCCLALRMSHEEAVEETTWQTEKSCKETVGLVSEIYAVHLK